MILAGAGGHARELYDLISSGRPTEQLFCFEEMGTANELKWGSAAVKLTGYEALNKQLAIEASFALAVGDPSLREKFFQVFTEEGGIPESIIADTAIISELNVELGVALNIMHFVFISNNVTIGKGVLLNTGCRIHHDCVIGEFSEISPNATITGNCSIGKKCSIGASATILPGITIGDNVVVGAGAVVTKHIESNSAVAGVPAVLIRKH